MKIIILNNTDKFNMDTICEVKKIEHCIYSASADCGECHNIPTCNCGCRSGRSSMLYTYYNTVHCFRSSVCEHNCCILEE